MNGFIAPDVFAQTDGARIRGVGTVEGSPITHQTHSRAYGVHVMRNVITVRTASY